MTVFDWGQCQAVGLLAHVWRAGASIANPRVNMPYTNRASKAGRRLCNNLQLTDLDLAEPGYNHRNSTSVQVSSKLPDVGTTIFTTMSALAAQHDAINLSQGFPDFDAPPALLDAVQHFMRSGHNQYPPMAGAPQLRQAISNKVAQLYHCEADWESCITVTAGATQALFCAIAAVVHPGDEVIVFDPAYDSYEPVVRLQGGFTRHVPLDSTRQFCVDWQRVEDAINPKTRVIILNTPHNPTGAVWSAADMAELERLAEQHNLLVISDEVYEHMVFDGERHISVCANPTLAARSFVISSFGKTYHATGWKVGYCVAPPQLMLEFRRVHQYVNFTVNTPMQLGLADFLRDCPEHHLELPAFYQHKRDLFCRLLSQSAFEVVPSQGTYFQLLDYDRVSQATDADLAVLWTQELGVASIPVSVFYADPTQLSGRFLRFCFAKQDTTLHEAAQILCAIEEGAW